MRKHTRTFASLITAGALLAVPATALAKPDTDTAKGKSHKNTPNCTKATHNIAFSLGGTLVSAVPDNPATAESEATVTLMLTSANSHAKRSGNIADQNTTKKGVQVKGATFIVPAGDAYVLKLNGYEGADTASPGDKVKVHGKITMTKKKCAPAGTSIADRLGAIDVRRVTISDRDAD